MQDELIRKFVFESVLDKDTQTKSVILLGKIDSQDAIIIAQKTDFVEEESALKNLVTSNSLVNYKEIDSNDVYHWYTGILNAIEDKSPSIKFTLIYPATESHIRKYRAQNLRMVVETPQIYKKYILPYIILNRESQIKWVYNILEHKTESESIIYEDEDQKSGFILLPDMKWDRKTMSSLYLVVLTHRRDIYSLRDLKKSDVSWLKNIRKQIHKVVEEKYNLKPYELRLFVHYHPSYYHFHIHVTNVTYTGIRSQLAAGKANILENLISQLETLPDSFNGFEDSTFTYIIGTETNLWKNVFGKEDINYIDL